MRISDKTIDFLQTLVTGDSKLTEYRSGPQLVKLFRSFGFRDEYGQGFPSRWAYATEKIQILNGTKELGRLVCLILNPVNFVESEAQLQSIIEKLNKYLAFDGYAVVLRGKRCLITQLANDPIEIEHQDRLSDDFIQEQIEKLGRKLTDRDFDGAITNSRSLVEGVLAELHEKLTGEQITKTGDLRQDFKKVRSLLNLSPEMHSDEAVRQVLNGLNSIVDGIDSLSNQMGDRHRRRLKPQKRHAKLAVNAARTCVDFLVDTYLARGKS
jgi:hypothetical protein